MTNPVTPVFENRLRHVVAQFSTDVCECGAIAFLRHVKPVLQNGPQCGLVTLQMASTMLGFAPVQIEHILEVAKQKRFTNRGEMFSVDWLCALALAIWPDLQGEVRQIPEAKDLCKMLRDGYAVLMAYDCDKNNEPAMLNGTMAHWCIIVGYLCRDPSQPQLIWSAEEPQSYRSMYVFCLHGKSRHLAVWNYENLVESNANLHEFGDKRAKDGHFYVLPPEGVSALRQKCLLLHQ